MKNKKSSIGKINFEEVILKIGAEGGSLNIQRFQTPDGKWKFIFIVDESTMADFLNEEDQIDLVKKYPPVDTFEEALQLMNKYPWRELQLVTVHQEYAEFIESEMKNTQTLNRRKCMNAQGQLTSAVAKSISVELNKMGYDVYYDHKKGGEFTGTIPVSIGKELGREEEISQLDIAIVERNSDGEGNLRRAIALIEVEETTDNPKKLIGDIFAVLLGTSTYLPGGEQVDVRKGTTLIIIGKDASHGYRNELICKMAMKAKSSLETENSEIGDIVIKTFSENNPLNDVLMEQIKKAIQREKSMTN